MDNVTLKITRTGHRNLGRCYNATTWLIESVRPLTWKAIQTIREAGVLGYGQEFFGKALKADGTQDVEWKAAWETGRKVYSYEVEDRVDSSD